MDIKVQQRMVGHVAETPAGTAIVAAKATPLSPSSLGSEASERLSSLAQRLSAAAERAALRDSQLSRKELAEVAASIKERIYGASYDFSKIAHDAHVPETEDSQWLESARQATDFLNGRGQNPFEGMGQEQLSLIAYDEGGSFTVNERRAAMMETGRQYGNWSKYITQKMWDEHQQTGKSTQGLKEILSYYKSLPPIEEAQFGNYEAQLLLQIAQQEVDWPEFNTSLIDMIANEWKPWAELDRSQSMADGDADEGEPS
ncbi:hypothetical protein [Pseudomonas sp. BP8]|uniref:hypothetical protein n=1 Tax=Pseudomonas sp. BP8 TaxID=2817864 RepID=UPI001AE85312|nr:hypothetical protein [Pseudomonas sp. BP8]MBP2264175.1 4'-phosphopantetheinyl transferase EntD [Pseudomonas sp. BP8]HDS1736426.1 hypothetical protein [Pseudomonas putida]